MVKKYAYTALFICLFAVVSHSAFAAASFVATVDRTTVGVGESFNLQLSLSGASPKDSPDLDTLKKQFTVYSASRSSQTTIINNRMSSSINWNVVLMPKQAGSLTIPSISVESDAGTLSTDPVKITATKAVNSAQAAQSRAAFVDVAVSKRDPYKNEPVTLTVKLVARRSITDVALPDFSVDDALVEKEGDPDVYDGVLQGQRVKVVEVHYLVTPLKDGTVTIPGITFQGKIDAGQRQSSFPRGLSDPFGMFDMGGFPGMGSFQPFAASADPVTLNVKPPAVQMDPWIPAYMVKISDAWDGLDNAKVGEPLTRKLTIIAEGVAGATLPSLENKIDPDGVFKIYADKPDVGESPAKDDKGVGGWRKESYTLIPQKSGTFTLPEIKIAWWDVLDNKIAYATVPAKTIKVKPGVMPPAEPAVQAQNTASQPQSDNTSPQAQTPPQQVLKLGPAVPPHLYGILAALAGAVLVMGGVIIYLLRKLSRYEKDGAAAPETKTVRAANEDSTSLADLKKATTAGDICKFIQSYAHGHWGLPQNAPLQAISAYIKQRDPKADITVFQTLDAALYAGKKVSIAEIKKPLPALLKGVRTGQEPAQRKGRKFGTLNPS